MFRDITSIDLFDQNADMACAKVRLRHMDITGIDLFDQIWMWHVPRVGLDYMDITSIDLFNQNVGMVCAKVTFRCSWISLVLVYLIKIWVWHVPKLDSDVYGYH